VQRELLLQLRQALDHQGLRGVWFDLTGGEKRGIARA